MSQTKTNLLAHIIWSTKNQAFQIDRKSMNELLGYLTNTVKNLGGTVFSASGFTDHVHMLLKYSLEISLANLLQKLKANSSSWMKTKPSISNEFSWQEGYTAFSVSKENVSQVCRYIEGEELRHVEISYLDELEKFLQMQSVPYDTRYYSSNTFSKLLIHMIWSTKNRERMIEKNQQSRLFTIIQNELQENRGQLISIGGVEDHIHMMVDGPRHLAISDLVRNVKTKSSLEMAKFIDGFSWQGGYGAFSVGNSAKDNVVSYIENQEEHHKIRSKVQDMSPLSGFNR